MKNYNYDVAISLCKEDVPFAQKLVKAINPNLKVFFYEYNQEELIGKLGPEVFAKKFKEESRIVVILSRQEWSKSYYTEIESNAIADRTRTNGFGFLFVIPLRQGEIPAWYPETRIYADPFKFTIEDLAHFIEFKVTEEGGTVKPLTLEDRYQHLIDRIEEKKLVISLQQTKEAIDCTKKEVDIFKEWFNEKIEFLKKSIFNQMTFYPFHGLINKAYISYGEFLLECQFILPDEMYHRVVTTQDFCVMFELFQTFGNLQNKELLEKEQRIFYYTPHFHGWALPYLYEEYTNEEMQVLFRNRNNSQCYDLKEPLRTASLVDKWFQRLFSHFSKKVERYI